jgi:hypothetical protein
MAQATGSGSKVGLVLASIVGIFSIRSGEWGTICLGVGVEQRPHHPPPGHAPTALWCRARRLGAGAAALPGGRQARAPGARRRAPVAAPGYGGASAAARPTQPETPVMLPASASASAASARRPSNATRVTGAVRQPLLAATARFPKSPAPPAAPSRRDSTQGVLAPNSKLQQAARLFQGKVQGSGGRAALLSGRGTEAPANLPSLGSRDGSCLHCLAPVSPRCSTAAALPTPRTSATLRLPTFPLPSAPLHLSP